MRPDLRVWLGRRVAVVVDRPLGTRHPRWPDLHYPINYGYIPGTISGDGAPIDAYLLGINRPVREATGIVVAVVLRADDVEDKLVVAPDGMVPPVAEIEAAIAFQERYFQSGWCWGGSARATWDNGSGR